MRVGKQNVLGSSVSVGGVAYTQRDMVELEAVERNVLLCAYVRVCLCVDVCEGELRFWWCVDFIVMFFIRPSAITRVYNLFSFIFRQHPLGCSAVWIIETVCVSVCVDAPERNALFIGLN